MEPDDLERRVRRLVAEQLPWLPRGTPEQADLVVAARIYGDDVWEFVEDFSKQFEVDMTGFRWEHHSGPEGCNLLWLLDPPWWSRVPHVPIRLADLVDSARRRTWCIRYPGQEAR
ncbi:DUF1493 family protein [Paludisphaera mucosa]|uniref:DUF1493 family protein n=1 Tax=Paludisphaera mucosa TaxID=3030827 RepID=A0ABT6FKH1_9BACT|nr:DUF1493 family protein [Paludisphaera mucosa]MDG3007885.1 DUF1493 family protein [Paludisphaera mucosa]